MMMIRKFHHRIRTGKLKFRTSRNVGISTNSSRNPCGKPPSKPSIHSTCSESADWLDSVQFCSGKGRPDGERTKNRIYWTRSSSSSNNGPSSPVDGHELVCNSTCGHNLEDTRRLLRINGVPAPTRNGAIVQVGRRRVIESRQSRLTQQ